jgi:hypothetical protein
MIKIEGSLDSVSKIGSGVRTELMIVAFIWATPLMLLCLEQSGSQFSINKNPDGLNGLSVPDYYCWRLSLMCQWSIW